MKPGFGRVPAAVAGSVLLLALVPPCMPQAMAAATPVPSPSLVMGTPVDPNDAVTLPVEDVVGRSEALVFAEASVDGAVTDRGGREFTLASDVLFAFDKATLTSRARTEIARIAGVLKASSGQGSEAGSETGSEPAAGKVTTVTISGYTDDVGSDQYNLGLSRRRAAAVRGALATALGSTIAVTAVGRGENDPVATNSTERGRQANRRVEIRGR